MSNLFTNMNTEEITVKFHSGEYKIPHSGYERCTLIKNKQQTLEGDWTDITFDKEVMNQMNKTKDLDGVTFVEIVQSGTYLIMFQGEGADDFRVTRNEESILKSDSGSSIGIQLEAKDRIVLQGKGSGEVGNIHLCVIRIF